MKRIVIVGGGAAGIQVATRLGRKLGKRGKAHVVLVDRQSTHLWKPLLHEVAAGRLEPTIHSTSFAMHAGRNSFEFIQAEFRGMDRVSMTVSVALTGTAGTDEVSLSYDYLVLALGGVTQYFGVPGAQQYALSLDSVTAAENVRNAVLSAIRKHSAAAAMAGAGAVEPARVVIVGAGATGVQLAAELRDAIAEQHRYGVHQLDPVDGVDIHIVEGSPHVLAGMDRQLATVVESKLRSRKVRISTGMRVTGVTERGVQVDGEQFLEADVVVWAAGVAAPPGLDLLGLPVTARGQIQVDTQLQSYAEKNVYALGDCASCTPAGSTTALPTRAQVAFQQALYLARAIPRRLVGLETSGFVFKDHGSLVSLSSGGAVGAFDGALKSRWYVKGRLAAALHYAIYRRHLLSVQGPLRLTGMTIVQYIERLLGSGTRLYVRFALHIKTSSPSNSELPCHLVVVLCLWLQGGCTQKHRAPKFCAH